MSYHVHIFVPTDGRKGGLRRGDSFFWKNLSEEELRQRIIGSWERGEQMTWSGETAPSVGAEIRIYYTDDQPPKELEAFYLLEFLRENADDRTNDLITAPAGSKAVPAGGASQAPSALRDPRRVMVVHGRNLEARNAMFTFLRALGLAPIEWEQAIAETGMGSPHNLDAVRAAMDVAQAVIVILTAEDVASLIPALFASGEDNAELIPQGQPRQNVILEAGLAMGVGRERTIFVELGPIRRASDFDGLNAVRMSNAAATRGALRSRLVTAGCPIAESGNDWMNANAGGDFESCLVSPP